MENEYYVYEWFIEETGEVFYVGKGKGDRAKSKNRNKFFKDMYNTHNCNYRIVKDNMLEREAFEYEIELISHYRKNYQEYRLTNMTDGGEGTSGWTPDENFKEKQKKLSKERWNDEEYRAKIIKIRQDINGVYKSDEFRNKISSLVQKENNPNYKNYWSTEQKEYMSKKMTGRYGGEKNPNYGNEWTQTQRKHLSEIRKNPKYNNENHGMAKRVICLETYEIFSCVKYCKAKHPDATSIRDKRKIAKGKHFMPIDDDYKIDKEKIWNELINFYKQLSKPSYIIFMCVETNEVIKGKAELLKKIKLSPKGFKKNIKENKGILKYDGFTYVDIKNYSPYI